MYYYGTALSSSALYDVRTRYESLSSLTTTITSQYCSLVRMQWTCLCRISTRSDDALCTLLPSLASRRAQTLQHTNSLTVTMGFFSSEHRDSVYNDDQPHE